VMTIGGGLPIDVHCWNTRAVPARPLVFQPLLTPPGLSD